MSETKPADNARGYDFASALAAAEALKRRKLKPDLWERAIAAARLNGETEWLEWFESTRKREAGSGRSYQAVRGEGRN